ncbi:hypothetical protein KC341_g36 [Hortaea werneckii]|nr:hypothetical protein KC341_g36 [Hortaea werneckii]
MVFIQYRYDDLFVFIARRRARRITGRGTVPQAMLRLEPNQVIWSPYSSVSASILEIHEALWQAAIAQETSKISSNPDGSFSCLTQTIHAVRNVSELRLCELGSRILGIEKWYAIQRKLPQP